MWLIERRRRVAVLSEEWRPGDVVVQKRSRFDERSKS